MKNVRPIVARELRVAARRPATWRARLAVASVAIFGMAAILLMLKKVPPNQLGSAIFLQLSLAAGWAALIGGPALTGDSISREHREGTLGLLFLTDLGGWDIVLGKMAAAAWNAGYCLLGVVPVLAMTILLGGVTLGQVGLLAVALLNALFFSLSVGMLASSFCREARQAASLAFSAVLGLVLCPWAVFVWLTTREHGLDAVEAAPVLLASPFLPFAHVALNSFSVLGAGLGISSPMPFPVRMLAFVLSIALQQLFAWSVLWIVARRVRTVWQEKSASSARGWRAWLTWFRYGDAVRRAALRRRLLDRNAFLWLAQREVWKAWYPWLLFVGLGGAFLFGIAQAGVRNVHDFAPLFLLAANAMLGVWVASESAQRLCEERQSGALELLLTTPLGERGILAGQSQGVRRLLLWPFVLLFAVNGWTVWASGDIEEGGMARTLLMGLVCYVRALAAMRWIATRQALRGQPINLVMATALGLGVILPLALANGIPPAIVWAADKLGLDLLREWTTAESHWISFGICLGWLETARWVTWRSARRDFRELVSRPLRDEVKESWWRRLGRAWRSVGRATP